MPVRVHVVNSCTPPPEKLEKSFKNVNPQAVEVRSLKGFITVKNVMDGT